METKEIMEQARLEIEKMKDRLANEDLNNRDAKKLEKQIKKAEKSLKSANFWTDLGNKTTSAGEKLEKTGKSVQKAGLHTTAAVWTPALYVGYRVIRKNKDKGATITSPEDHLINFIRECDQGYKEGKIDEETMKKYIVDFTNNYYRNEKPPQS